MSNVLEVKDLEITFDTYAGKVKSYPRCQF